MMTSTGPWWVCQPVVPPGAKVRCATVTSAACFDSTLIPAAWIVNPARVVPQPRISVIRPTGGTARAGPAAGTAAATQRAVIARAAASIGACPLMTVLIGGPHVLGPPAWPFGTRVQDVCDAAVTVP